MDIYAKNIVSAAADLELKQEEIAKKLGVGRAFVSHVMTGRKAVSATQAIPLSRILKSAPEKISQDFEKILGQWLKDRLKDQLESAAQANGNSLLKEITIRLETSFNSKLSEYPAKLDEMMDKFQSLIGTAEALHRQLQEKDDIIKSQKEVISRKK